jgi:hypothetical protein
VWCGGALLARGRGRATGQGQAPTVRYAWFAPSTRLDLYVLWPPCGAKALLAAPSMFFTGSLVVGSWRAGDRHTSPVLCYLPSCNRAVLSSSFAVPFDGCSSIYFVHVQSILPWSSTICDAQFFSKHTPYRISYNKRLRHPMHGFGKEA